MGPSAGSRAWPKQQLSPRGGDRGGPLAGVGHPRPDPQGGAALAGAGNGGRARAPAGGDSALLPVRGVARPKSAGLRRHAGAIRRGAGSGGAGSGAGDRPEHARHAVDLAGRHMPAARRGHPADNAHRRSDAATLDDGRGDRTRRSHPGRRLVLVRGHDRVPVSTLSLDVPTVCLVAAAVADSENEALSGAHAPRRRRRARLSGGGADPVHTLGRRAFGGPVGDPGRGHLGGSRVLVDRLSDDRLGAGA